MSAYYNEIDPFAVAWLQELMRHGQIEPGEIDTRSIVDVRPDDLRGFTRCHFFACIGGWAHALDLAGWPRDRECWTGSCPCQPWSVAGASAGTDDSRHLWPAWFPLIRECRPHTIFGEQTASRDGEYWLDIVSADLEGADYALGTFDLPASGVGAPHRRQRFFFVAHDDRQRRPLKSPARLHADGQSRHDAARCGAAHGMADASGRGQRADGPAPEPPQPGHADERRAGDLAEPAGERWREEQGRAAVALDGPSQQSGRQGRASGLDDTPGGRCRPGARDARDASTAHEEPGPGADRNGELGQPAGPRLEGGPGCGPGGPGRQRPPAQRAGETRRLADAECAERRAHADGRGDEHAALALGPEGASRLGERRPAERVADADGGHPGDGDLQRDDRHGLGAADSRPHFWADAEWVRCVDGKARPIEPGTFPLAHGVPARVGRLRGYGNAIVPQVAAALIRAYLDVQT